MKQKQFLRQNEINQPDIAHIGHLKIILKIRFLICFIFQCFFLSRLKIVQFCEEIKYNNSLDEFMDSLKQNKHNIISSRGINQSSSSIPISQLQSHLLTLWTTYSVDQTYQNLFLMHIQTFKHNKQQRKLIEAEIKKTYQKNTLYFLLNENIELRAAIKSQIEDQISIQTRARNFKKPHKVDIVLRELCDKLKNLRRINLLISETIIKIFEDFKISRQSNIGAIGKNYIELFIKIDSQNSFLKQSFLNEFILFQKGYDPFLLVHYEEIMKSQNPSALKKYKPVEQLFQLNISYVYRLMRAQQKMLKYMLLIDDKTGTQKQRKELINRQRLIKIANSDKIQNQNDSSTRGINFPLINRPGYPRREDISRVSTIKQHHPHGPARLYSNQHQQIEEDDESECSSCVRKKYHSMKPIRSQNYKNSIGNYSAVFTPKNDQKNRSLNDLIDNQRQKRDQYYIDGTIFNRKSRENPFVQQKKWNTRRMKDDRRYLRPIRTQQSDVSQHQTVEQGQFQQNNYRDQLGSKKKRENAGKYPVYISLKKSKLADEEVQQLSKNHEKYVRKNESKEDNPVSKKYNQKNSPKKTYSRQYQREDKQKSYNPRTNDNKPKLRRQKQVQSDYSQGQKQPNSRYPSSQLKQKKYEKQNEQSDGSNAQSENYPENQEQINEQSGEQSEAQSQNIQAKNQREQSSEQQNAKQSMRKINKQKPSKYNQSQSKSKKQPIKQNSRHNEQQNTRKLPKNYDNNSYYQTDSPNNKKINLSDNLQRPSNNRKNAPEGTESPQDKKKRLPDNKEAFPKDKNLPNNKQIYGSNGSKKRKSDDPPSQNQRDSPLSKAKIPPKPQKNVAPGSSDNSKKDPSSKDSQKRKKQQQIQSIPSERKSISINQNSKIKMLPGKVNFKDFQAYLKGKKVHSAYKNSFSQSLKFILTSAQNTQTYLNEFTLNEQLAIVALCSPTSSGNIVIYLWAPIQGVCDQKTSGFLFKKYIDYLEQQTTFKSIVYRGQQNSQIKLQKFELHKQRHYFRKRVKPVTRESFQFQYFFSAQISNISFAQSSKDSLLYSDEIVPFTENNSWCNSVIIKAKADQIPEQLEQQWSLQENLKSLKDVNALLQKDSYDTYQVGQQKQMNFQNISLSRSMLATVPKQGFIANQGFMIVVGNNLSISAKNKKSNKIQLFKDTVLYFGEGFQSVSEMIDLLKKQKQKAKQQETKFAFKMFSKQLYGRYVNQKSELQNGKAYYCNWDINFAWRDQIAGKVLHNVQTVKNKYGPQNFILVVQMKGILTFGAQIIKQDFLF